MMMENDIRLQCYEDSGPRVLKCHNNSKIYIQELWFLRSAGRLIFKLVNISMSFHEDILNGFQVTVRTRFCH